MKLYYSPVAGALASHITVRELDLDVELVRVDVQGGHKTEFGDDYYQINPKGYVPFLTIDSDTNLSESATILQFLADQDPDARMFPRRGSPQRYQAQEWLTFVGTEPQRILTAFFVKGHLTDAGLEFAKAKLHQRLTTMDDRLAQSEHLVDTNYSVADAYAFAILNWIPTFGLDVDLGKYDNLNTYLDKIRSREAVQVALKEEGLLN